MSEVHAHFVDRFFGIIRAVNLAKEALVIDGPALPSANNEIDLGAGIDPATSELIYHAWIMSDGLMLSYLLLCGIPPEKVKRYTAPWPNHILYVIDTRDVAAYREAHDFQPCNSSFINLKFLSWRQEPISVENRGPAIKRGSWLEDASNVCPLWKVDESGATKTPTP
jgi:hypothetical protein